MAAITFTLLDDWLIANGWAATPAAAVQVMINRMTAAFPTVALDVGLIQMLSKTFTDLQAVVKGVYEAGDVTIPPSVAHIDAWILANRPDLVGLDAMFEGLIRTDLYALIPAIPAAESSPNGTSTTWSSEQRYLEVVTLLLEKVIWYTRHFVTVAQTYPADSMNAGLMLTPPFPPSSIPGVSEFYW
jgi:hypothetical protein